MRLSTILTLVALPIWGASLFALWGARRWLLFYIFGAFGSVAFVVLAVRITGLNAVLEGLEARQVEWLARPLGQTLVVLGTNGLAIRNHTGWGVFDIGIECSALLEMATIAALILFYPAVFDVGQRLWLLAVGVVLTYAFNLIRILFIVQVVSTLGTDWVFAAHAVFGRLLFFVLTIALYWKLITVPTIKWVGARLEDDNE